jgi:hypothetical protein
MGGNKALKWALCLGLVVAGCLGPPVETPMTTVTQDTPIRVPQNARNKVDVLFMVDNSSSMDAMQAQLRAHFGDFFQVFNGLAAAGTYADLHIGVVTSDYGAGNVGVTGGCDKSPGGQRGLLQIKGQAAATTCQVPGKDPALANGPANAPYIAYQFTAGAPVSNLPNGQDLITSFTCMASVDAKGCGFEHQLESVYAALHNTNENAGFLRDDALLTVVFVTNEDDSSADPSTDIYDPNKSQPPNMGGYGYYDTYRQTRYGIACMEGGSLQLTPYASSMGPLMSCQAAPNQMPGDVGREFDIQRYISYFTTPKVSGGVKINPDDVILVGIEALQQDGTVGAPNIVLADPNTGNGKAPKPTYTYCGALAPPACVVRMDHVCQNQADPAFFGDTPIRLTSVINSVKYHQLANICGDDLTKEPDYTKALQQLGALISSTIAAGCIPAPLYDISNPDCVVQDVTANADGTTSIAQLPRCDAAAGVFPCWTVEMKMQCSKPQSNGVPLSPQGVGVTVYRCPMNSGCDAPANTNARVECNTIAQPAGSHPDGGP